MLPRVPNLSKFETVIMILLPYRGCSRDGHGGGGVGGEGGRVTHESSLKLTYGGGAK